MLTLEPKAAHLLPARDEFEGPRARRQAFDQYVRVIRHEAVGKNCHVGSSETNQELLAYLVDDAAAGEVWDTVPGADAEVITLASDVRERVQTTGATDLHVALIRKRRAEIRCRAKALPHDCDAGLKALPHDCDAGLKALPQDCDAGLKALPHDCDVGLKPCPTIATQD